MSGTTFPVYPLLTTSTLYWIITNASTSLLRYLLPFLTNHNLGFIHIYSHASILHVILPLHRAVKRLCVCVVEHWHSLSLLIRSPWLSALLSSSESFVGLVSNAVTKCPTLRLICCCGRHDERTSEKVAVQCWDGADGTDGQSSDGISQPCSVKLHQRYTSWTCPPHV